jgi:hypothetical protein
LAVTVRFGNFRRSACVLYAVVGVACNAAPDPLATTRSPIIDGTVASEATGVCPVSHPAAGFVCSGVVIHPSAVLTAKHCVFGSAEPFTALPPAGFRLRFGPSVDAVTERAVERVEWIEAPDDTDVTASVSGGQDVALLYLTEPVPPRTHVHRVELEYAPAVGHEYTLVGFGVSSLDTGESGVRLSSLEQIAAYDPDTGRIQTSGNGACRGDSGGPLLYGNEQAVVGVISEIGGSSDAQFCDIGTTIASSVANAAVGDFLEQALSALPACVDEVCGNGQDENCDDVPDDGCAVQGDACEDDAQCQTGICRDAGEGLVCVPGCEPACSAGQSCDLVDGAATCVDDGAAGSAGAAGRAGASLGGAPGDDAGAAGTAGSKRKSDSSGCSVTMGGRQNGFALAALLLAMLLSTRRTRTRTRR